MTAAVDVSRIEDVAGLEAAVQKRFGGTDILMNNAGIGRTARVSARWRIGSAFSAVNLWGIIHGTQAFAPHMIERGRPGLIINTGSKQGITTPPGNPAYNVSKAGVKALHRGAATRIAQHERRQDQRASASFRVLSLPASPRAAAPRSRPARGRRNRPSTS